MEDYRLLRGRLSRAIDHICKDCFAQSRSTLWEVDELEIFVVAKSTLVWKFACSNLCDASLPTPMRCIPQLCYALHTPHHYAFPFNLANKRSTVAALSSLASLSTFCSQLLNCLGPSPAFLSLFGPPKPRSSLQELNTFGVLGSRPTHARLPISSSGSRSDSGCRSEETCSTVMSNRKVSRGEIFFVPLVCRPRRIAR